ncbi:hypothetical protein QCA50_009407 [Cerrena zonata]|uniref:Maturase K n=1 Tax=Cerrena zonata TaxID=2478898 RepID=A0AAW0GC67_9APHY
MFYPLQSYIYNVSIQRYNTDPQNSFDIEIENILLLAFRDVIILPVLMARKKIYEDFKHQQLSQQQAPTSTSSSIQHQNSIIEDEQYAQKLNYPNGFPMQSSASSISFSPYDSSHHKLRATPSSSRQHASSYTNRDLDRLKTKEKKIFQKDDGRLSRNIINCFGVIVSHSYGESGNTDGEQHIRDSIFNDAFTWITNI